MEGKYQWLSRVNQANLALLIHISRIILLPKVIIVIPSLRRERNGHGNRTERNAGPFKLLESPPRKRLGLVHAVDGDAMARAGDVQPPVPGGPDVGRLRVQGVVPAAAHDLDPALDVAREVNLPGPPRPLALGREVLQGHGVPVEAAVGRDLDALRPAPAARVRPALALDLAVVDDDLLGPRRHDGRADGHLLDLDAVGPLEVVLADLLREVQVLLALDGRAARLRDGPDAVQPLDAARADVAEHDDAQGKPVDARQRRPVHLPRQQHLVGLDLGPRHADQVVHEPVVLDVRVAAVELEVLGLWAQPAARLDHLFQADAHVPRRADGALGPRRLWYLVALPGVLGNLLNAPGARALHRDRLLDAREPRLVHDVVEGKGLRVVDQAVEREAVGVPVDDGDPAVVPHKVEVIRRDGLVRHEPLGRLAVVWELQQMQHIWVFLLENRLPRVLGNRRQLAAQGVVPHFPSGSWEHRVRARDGAELELGIGREVLRFENLVRRLLLLGIVLPLYIAVVKRDQDQHVLWS